MTYKGFNISVCTVKKDIIYRIGMFIFAGYKQFHTDNKGNIRPEYRLSLGIRQPGTKFGQFQVGPLWCDIYRTRHEPGS